MNVQVTFETDFSDPSRRRREDQSGRYGQRLRNGSRIACEHAKSKWRDLFPRTSAGLSSCRESRFYSG